MHESRYFERALWLPIALPVVLFAIYAVGSEYRLSQYLPDTLVMAAAVLMWSLVVGGVQYLFCREWASDKLRKATVAQAIRFWWRFPLVFFLVELATLEAIALTLSATSSSWDGVIDSMLYAGVISLFALPVGYFYTLLVVGGYYLRRKLMAKRASNAVA